MTRDDVRAAAERLVDFHERFAPLFGKVRARTMPIFMSRG